MSDLRPYRALPLGKFGVEVTQVDLRDTLPASRVVLELLREHSLLLFRRQELTPSDQVSLSRAFGDVEIHRPALFQPDGLREIFRVASVASEGHLTPGQYWHADGLAFEDPPPIVILNTIVAPAEGGETGFIDACHAWQALPTAVRSQVENSMWTHVRGRVSRFCRQHPRTLRNALLVNLGQMRPPDVEPTPAIGIVEVLTDWLNRLPAYTHTWRPGDVIVLDNLAILHRGYPVPPGTRRILDRTVVARLHSAAFGL